MRDKLAYIFDGNKMIAITKTEVLTDLIDMHMIEINLSLEKQRGKLKEYQVKNLEDFIESLNNTTKTFHDENENKTYPSYKAYKKEKIKCLVYNESDISRFNELNNNEINKYKIIDSEDEIVSDIDANI